MPQIFVIHISSLDRAKLYGSFAINRYPPITSVSHQLHSAKCMEKLIWTKKKRNSLIKSNVYDTPSAFKCPTIDQNNSFG